MKLITLVYLPLRLYGDWRTKQGDRHSHLVKSLYQGSDVLMTGILFPVTLYADFMFWYLYINDPALLAPPILFKHLPNWAQHSLHTVSLIVVLLDLVITPRKRPPSLKPRISVLIAFWFIYTMVVHTSYSKGEMVYAVFEKMDLPLILLSYVLSLVTLLALFVVQWPLIHLIHETNQKKKKSS